MEKEIDVENWDRRESYEFFRGFADPFVGIAVEIEVSSFYHYCRTKSISIHHALLYCTLAAANNYAPMRLRRTETGVVEHSTIDIGCSVLKTGTEAFTFAYYPWRQGESASEFLERTETITRKAAEGLPLDPRPDRTNLIYGTTLPWISFTDFKHPKQGGGHSIPRTVFGKIFERKESYFLPFHLEVDHALMDGIHMAKYFEHLERELNLFCNENIS